MPADDRILDSVINALIKDGWTILADPHLLKYGNDKLYADLAAERALTADRAEEQIVIEVKSFAGASLMQELERAVGQYLIYRAILDAGESENRLYLAVTDLVYKKLSQRSVFSLIMQVHHPALIVVDADKEEIIQWIN